MNPPNMFGLSKANDYKPHFQDKPTNLSRRNKKRFGETRSKPKQVSEEVIHALRQKIIDRAIVKSQGHSHFAKEKMTQEIRIQTGMFNRSNEINSHIAELHDYIPGENFIPQTPVEANHTMKLPFGTPKDICANSENFITPEDFSVLSPLFKNINATPQICSPGPDVKKEALSFKTNFLDKLSPMTPIPLFDLVSK
jgi:hypothetical protein